MIVIKYINYHLYFDHNGDKPLTKHPHKPDINTKKAVGSFGVLVSLSK
ncbi:hypothetical protein MT354_01470 [Clostridium tertium]|nr:hypothetical protein [Clostridium tertium]